jgi:hypothetical protein
MSKRLSIFGKMIRAMEGNPEPKETSKFDWKDAMCDAVIMASISGLSAYIGTRDLIGSILAGALSFFIFLGVK